MTAKRESLTMALDRLAETDSDVRRASERLDWLALKVLMGWPEPRRIHKSSPPDEPAKG